MTCMSSAIDVIAKRVHIKSILKSVLQYTPHHGTTQCAPYSIQRVKSRHIC